MSLTPTQLEFRSRLTKLLEEFADAVGPSWDGDVDEGAPLRVPVMAGWVLVAQWDDLDPADAYEHDGATVFLSSGISSPMRIGLLSLALDSETCG